MITTIALSILTYFVLGTLTSLATGYAYKCECEELETEGMVMVSVFWPIALIGLISYACLIGVGSIYHYFKTKSN